MRGSPVEILGPAGAVDGAHGQGMHPRREVEFK
jgi:hypothetical protein